MKAIQEIITKRELDLKITEVTILSTEEAENVPNKLRVAYGECWLRSAGSQNDRAAFVHSDGTIDYDGANVEVLFNIRPVLRISNLNTLNLDEGDVFELASRKWTVIPGGMALCSEIYGTSRFRTYTCSDGEYFITPDRKKHLISVLNDYRYSDIRKNLKNWTAKDGIVIK